jgi:hypothetical protein
LRSAAIPCPLAQQPWAEPAAAQSEQLDRGALLPQRGGRAIYRVRVAHKALLGPADLRHQRRVQAGLKLRRSKLEGSDLLLISPLDRRQRTRKRAAKPPFLDLCR